MQGWEEELLQREPISGGTWQTDTEFTPHKALPEWPLHTPPGGKHHACQRVEGGDTCSGERVGGREV